MTEQSEQSQRVIQAAVRVAAEGLEANPMAGLSHEALRELRAAVRAAGLLVEVEERSWYTTGYSAVRRENCSLDVWERLPYRRTIGPWERRS